MQDYYMFDEICQENPDIILNYLCNLYDMCQEMILIYNTSGYVIRCNKVAMEKLDYGQYIYEVNITNIFRNVYQLVDGKVELIKINSNTANESSAYCSNLTCFPVKIKVSKIHVAGLEYGICFALDVTDISDIKKEKELMAQEVLELNKSQNEYIANISHELKTPLNGILGLIDSIKSDHIYETEEESFRMIGQCCLDMKNMIEMILDHAALKSGKECLYEEKFNLRELINDIVNIHRKKIDDKNLCFHLNIESDIPEYFIGDEFRLKSIIGNLLDNAIKFTQVGYIYLDIMLSSVENGNANLFFNFMDTGIGISKQNQEKLFQSFSQVDGSIKRKYGGTGLGLSITKSLIEMMQGSIMVDSEEGKGSTFSFIIKLKLHKDSGMPEELIQTNLRDMKEKWELGYIQTHRKAVQTKFKDDSNYNYVNRIKMFDTQENIAEIKGKLEKIQICIDMEKWDKMEYLIDALKILIPEEQSGMRKKLFQLELSLRKCDFEKSINYINEIEHMIM